MVRKLIEDPKELERMKYDKNYVRDVADSLNFQANLSIGDPEDVWRYTRKHGLKSMVPKKKHTTDTLRYRILDTVESLIHRKVRLPRGNGGRVSSLSWFRYKWITLSTGMRKDNHLPDGKLANRIYTVWEEDADYLVMVQPLVGMEIAKFLKEYPEHPSAIKIAKIMSEASRESYKEAKDHE